VNLALGCTYDSLSFVDSRDDYLLIYSEPSIPYYLEDEYQEYVSLLFNLSLSGKIIFNSKVNSITLNDESADVFLGSQKRNIPFENCRVYSTKGVNVTCSDLVSCRDQYYVYDEVDMISISDVPTGDIHRDSNFINRVWFNISAKHPKLAVSKSILGAEEKDKIEYSDTYVKFKLMSILADMGFSGRKNGFDNHGNQLYLGLDLNCTSRHIHFVSECVYEDTRGIVFCNAQQ
tara:strand:+ start:40153 stop:40848 length:696 start_codon:yes stop_codon:yes gene_type:complete